MLIHELFLGAAAGRQDALALIEGERQTTYGELQADAARVTRGLRGRGVQPGDRVVLALENSRESVAAYLGALAAGAVVVPLPPGIPNDRLRRAIPDAQPVVCIVDRTTTVEPVLGEVTHRFVVSGDGGAVDGFEPFAALRADVSTPQPAAERRPEDLAVIIYTSGTTGVPRGVMLSHAGVVANTQAIVRYLGLGPGDRVMCVLPFSYVYGLSLLHTHLSVGGSLVLLNKFVFPNVVLAAMRTHEATGFAGVPSTFALLLQRSSLGREPFPALRYVTQAGGSLAPARILEWLERGPPVPFYVMYGATEASARLTYLPPDDLRRKIGSIGKPIDNVEIVIVKDDGRVAETGEVGELVAKGPNIAIGYWNDPEGTAERFQDGGYRTGDLGYADEEGFLFLVGRRHDMIKVGAHRVGAKEIEDVIHEWPAITEAVVLGVPDDLLGEVPVAVVTWRDAPDEAALLAFCRSRLAAYKVPIRVLSLPELPKLPTGKIDRRAVRADYDERRALAR
jgi:long-chain acyl-CoA synthetase